MKQTMHIQRDRQETYCGRWTGATPARLPLEDYLKQTTARKWCRKCVLAVKNAEEER